jgi:hypothetical protein
MKDWCETVQNYTKVDRIVNIKCWIISDIYFKQKDN